MWIVYHLIAAELLPKLKSISWFVIVKRFLEQKYLEIFEIIRKTSNFFEKFSFSSYDVSFNFQSHASEDKQFSELCQHSEKKTIA